MPPIKLVLVIGQYTIDWHLPQCAGAALTDTVRRWRDHWPNVLPLPHPSPRNNIWLKANPWFEAEVLDVLLKCVATILAR
jgi:uracil-DNA glycosylase